MLLLADCWRVRVIRKHPQQRQGDVRMVVRRILSLFIPEFTVLNVIYGAALAVIVGFALKYGLPQHRRQNEQEKMSLTNREAAKMAGENMGISAMAAVWHAGDQSPITIKDMKETKRKLRKFVK